jgi:putative transposase
MDYIHFNPVKHGVAVHPAAWPFSSFRRCVAHGLYPEDWTVADVGLTEAGERGHDEMVG